MNRQFSLEILNAMSQQQFTAALGAIFEHSPWVAQRAAGKRPFASVRQLHDAMAAVVRAADADERLQLIRAHPELAGRAAMDGELTAGSTREQQGAGLDQCSLEELAQMQELNRSYNEKFGFPFVMAVKGHDRHSILTHFARRLENECDTEIDQCIEQIVKIAGFRLAEAVR